MIERRRFLLGASATLLLAGCTPGETINWLPWVPPSPVEVQVPPGLAAELASVRALAQHLVDRGATWNLDRARVDALAWFVAAIDEQTLVVLSTDPARRQTGPGPLPTAGPINVSSSKAAQADLDKRLSSLQASYRAAALTADGLPCLLWAGLSAFSAAARTRLAGGSGPLGNDTTGRTPDVHGTSTGQVVQLCDQARFGYQMALAAPSLSLAAQRPLRQRLAAWEQLRASLLAPEPTAAPSTVPIGYDIKPAGNLSGARRLAVTVESAALPLLGAWLASGPVSALRRPGVDALVSATTALVGFGGAALRWPGWPG